LRANLAQEVRANAIESIGVEIFHAGVVLVFAQIGVVGLACHVVNQ